MPKNKADISWITDDLLDALAFRESSMNSNAVNERSGASGMYQWMPAFWKEGKEVGFGVDKGKFDPFDPVESRKRTKQYLEGMQKYYPDWDPSEILMAYNWGHSKVKGLREGTLDISKENPKKVEEAMNYAPLILKHLEDKPWMENLDETGLEPTI